MALIRALKVVQFRFGLADRALRRVLVRPTVQAGIL